MPYADALRHFDPNTPFALPITIAESLGDVVPRAMAILHRRSKADIQNGLTLLHRLYPIGEGLWGQRAGQLMRDNGAPLWPTSASGILQAALSEIPLAKNQPFPKAQTAELYALLALGLVGDLVSQERNQPRMTEGPYQLAQSYSASIMYGAVNAMEAIGRAERAVVDPRYSGVIQAGRKGGGSKYADITYLRNECLMRYTIHFEGKMSVRKAARLIYQSLPPLAHNLWPRSTDPEAQRIQRIEKWVGRYLRNEIPVLGRGTLRRPARLDR